MIALASKTIRLVAAAAIVLTASSPLAATAMSSMPGIASIIATSRARSRRTSGSPPVNRMLRTPTLAAARTISAISS